MRNLVLAVVILIILVGGYLLLRGNYGGSQTTSTTKAPEATGSSAEVSTEETIAEQVTITYASSGFSPSTVTVKSGGKIVWVNTSNKAVEVASDPHPSHTANQEISGGSFSLLVAAGEQREVVVTKTGTFGYHNHLDPGQGGTIIVE